ncbi:ATP-binding protein [Plantibacter sp. YIM 135347]|uniref:ATP-binding protein n=1 Tax=Plantibacter sp. YIM 135347 TaxID=3423919 RepID=UPI003D32E9D5
MSLGKSGGGASVLRRLGGRDALTVWSWLVTAPFVVAILGGEGIDRSPIEDGGPGTWAGVAIVVQAHVLTGVLMLAIRSVLVALPAGRVRGWTALGGFAVIGLTRPAFIGAVAVANGVEPPAGDLGIRIAVNVVCSVVGLGLIAIVVSGLRDAARARRRLRDARNAMLQCTAADDAALIAVRRAHLDDLEHRILDALDRSPLRPEDPTAAARLLRGLSEDVVRPLSHELLELAETDDGDDIVDVAERAQSERVSAERVSAERAWPVPSETAARSGSETWTDSFRAVGPVLPLAVFAALIAPNLLSRFGAVGALLLLVGAATYLLGATVVTRIADRTRSFFGRAAVIIGGSVAVAGAGSMSTASVLMVAGGEGWIPRSPLVIYPAIVLAFVVLRGIARELERAEAESAASLRVEATRASLARIRLRDTRLRIARALHGTAQGDLVAAAFSVALERDREPSRDRARAPAGASAASADDAVREAIRAMLHHVHTAVESTALDETSHPSVPASGPRLEESFGRIQAVLDAWSAALDLTVDIDDAARSWLSTAGVLPGRLVDARIDIVVDVLTEGCTNAVRHGNGRGVLVRMRGVVGSESRDDHTGIVDSTDAVDSTGAVLVSITSRGRLRADATGGRGIELLRRIAPDVSLSQQGETVRLEATVV